jgi:hypothetical protein
VARSQALQEVWQERRTEGTETQWTLILHLEEQAGEAAFQQFRRTEETEETEVLMVQAGAVLLQHSQDSRRETEETELGE